MAKTYQQIQAQLAALQKEADVAKKREMQKVVREIKESIVLYGLTAEDLGLTADAVKQLRVKRKTEATSGEVSKANATKAGKSPSAKKAPAKKKQSRAVASTGFSDGSGNTWSGRGPRPNWFKDAVAQGKTPEDLRV